ncbi:p26 [Leucania separata nucleopolyhedrovirus]|uniref:p26 n=1 Tax=Leucania separata nucleopolyhedrovirus TaxID=1307956 RepID=Q0IL99_NPVLS|nr:p26 [Leucania separata nucleopolyhedrovirus]AAR28784.1 p26 [Leucania separata nucleopolyhedrovirus]
MDNLLLCHSDRSMRILKTADLNIRIFSPLSSNLIDANDDDDDKTDDDELDRLHHFPGVASTIVFPFVEIDQILYVMLSDLTLQRVHIVNDDHEPLFNFHVYKNRVVYGQLRSFEAPDRNVANKIYVGAPIFSDASKRNVVSVVTARCALPDLRFPVSGVRSEGLVSGQIEIDGEYVIQRQRTADTSVYGRKVATYADIKKFAIDCNVNKSAHRNEPRAFIVTEGDGNNTITIALVENQFEIFRVRMSGSLVAQNGG